MNKAILMGRLTRDPEMRQTQSGVAVANFTVAVDRRFKNKDGEYDTDFINCVAWRQQAEFVSKYFYKGKPILVVGTIQTRTWEDDEGKRRYATEVVVDEVSFTLTDRGLGQQTEIQDVPDESDDADMPLPFDL